MFESGPGEVIIFHTPHSLGRHLKSPTSTLQHSQQKQTKCNHTLTKKTLDLSEAEISYYAVGKSFFDDFYELRCETRRSFGSIVVTHDRGVWSTGCWKVHSRQRSTSANPIITIHDNQQHLSSGTGFGCLRSPVDARQFCQGNLSNLGTTPSICPGSL